MRVDAIMTSRPLVVSPDAPVDEVARLLVEHRLSSVPVVDAQGTLVGMVSETDLIVRNANLHLPTFLNVLDGFFPIRGRHEFDEEIRRTLGTRAADVMGEHLYTLAPDADVSDAATLMMDRHISQVPIVAGGTLVGVVGRRDIVRLMIAEPPAGSGQPT